MLNDLSLAQERHCLCGEEWIFQEDNAAIHNASTKNKISRPPSVLSIIQSYRKIHGD